ncbi:hypothetical protein ACFOSC_17110 [Streptantibioticus rubrisoli]|uniref:Uncharacterized protein n=1 Tax=Streptantibioticus rubrisoli TaxID=1387313 RepID=A0ABT1PKM8_9ACTN|nr:hypothetical protein [Streptantibioticus rubrisoli]MCQ4045923.1 hypothetical protein [Streptantibioticus rubrisoli]
MGGKDKDLHVDPEALRMTAEGLTATLGELKKLGIVESAEVGRGFSGIELTGLKLGHAGLTSALKGFGDRWEWGVRTLVHDGNEFAARLGLAAGSFHEEDQYVQGKFKNVVAAAVGNPDASDEQVSKESWGQVWADNPINQIRHADYSEQSLLKANTDVEKTWKAESKDWLQSNPAAVTTRTIADLTSDDSGSR